MQPHNKNGQKKDAQTARAFAAGVCAVIFRAMVGELDQEYAEAIERMKELAFKEYGCIELYALMDGESRVAISY